MDPDIRYLAPMAQVASVPRSIAFYAALGFSVQNSVTPPGDEEPTWAWLQSGKASLMVTKAECPLDPERQGILFYLYAEDVKVMRAHLVAKGLEPGDICYPFYAPQGEFNLTDPDGYCLMVSHDD